MRPDREAGLYGSLFRAGGEFSGFNFASFPSALISFHAAWGLAFQNYPQHKLLTSLRRSASQLFLLDFVSHAARMMRSMMASADFFLDGVAARFFVLDVSIPRGLITHRISVLV
jgi:hypothetical protein